MDSNKDEALRAVDLAKHFFNEGNRDKSKRLLQKAERLYPTQQAKDFLDLLNKLESTDTPSASSPNNGDEQDAVRQKARRRSRPKTQATAEEPKNYTPEQLEAVKKINTCKDYYEILSLTKEATDSDLKKAYKKLALQFHPDKNKCPGAAEAFKVIGKAFAVLSDVEKRKHYDMYGPEKERHESIRRSHHQHSHYSEFNGNVDAEEIFKTFFGDGFYGQDTHVPRNNRFQRHCRRRNQQLNNEFSSGSLLLMSILILVFSFMSHFPMPEGGHGGPVYSFQQCSTYPLKKVTSNLRVRYYVGKTFNSDYTGCLRRLEANIEKEYANALRHNCSKEESKKESMLMAGRYLADADLIKRAIKLKTPSCKTLKNLYP